MTIPKTHYTKAACYIGCVTQAIVNNLPTLLFVHFYQTYHIPLSEITLLITVNFLVQLVEDFLSAYFVDRIGYRTAIVLAHISATVGLVGLAVFPMILPPFAGLLLATVLSALGGGLIEVVVSPIVEACPSKNKAGEMSLLHSFYCWGTVFVVLFATGFFVLFGTDNWQYLTCTLALVPLFNTFFFLKVPIFTLTEEGEGMKKRELAKTGVFWLFVILMIASGASELSMSQWASALAESSLGVSKTVGDLLGACGFSVLMGCARVFYAKMSDKINLLHFIVCSGCLCIVSYLITAFSPNPWLSLAGCALCGLSVGIMWPGVYSMAAAGFPKGGMTMFAFLALAGDFGCSSGPTVVGFVSGLFEDNLQKGFAFGCIFPILLVSGCLVYRSYAKKMKEKERIAEQN